MPHVGLDFRSNKQTRLSRGSWESLKIKGHHGLALAFNDLDDLVRRIGQFLFSVGRFEHQSNATTPQETCTPMVEACWRQGVQVSDLQIEENP